MTATTKTRPFDPLDPLGRIAEHSKRSYDHDTIHPGSLACYWRDRYRDEWLDDTPAALRARRIDLRTGLAIVEQQLAAARAVFNDPLLRSVKQQRDEAQAVIARASARKERLSGMESAIWWLLGQSCGRVLPSGYPQTLRVVHVDDEIPDALYIGRPNGRRPPRLQRYGLEPRAIFGNPFVIGRDGDRATVIERYGEWILTRPELLDELPRARSHALECWCRHDGDREPGCHGDALIDMLDRYGDDELREMARKARTP